MNGGYLINSLVHHYELWFDVRLWDAQSTYYCNRIESSLSWSNHKIVMYSIQYTQIYLSVWMPISRRSRFAQCDCNTLQLWCFCHNVRHTTNFFGIWNATHTSTSNLLFSSLWTHTIHCIRQWRNVRTFLHYQFNQTDIYLTEAASKSFIFFITSTSIVFCFHAEFHHTILLNCKMLFNRWMFKMTKNLFICSVHE